MTPAAEAFRYWQIYVLSGRYRSIQPINTSIGLSRANYTSAIDIRLMNDITPNGVIIGLD